MSIEPIAMGEILPEATLEDCERVYGEIERNANLGRGAVLRHIRDNRLYRDLFATFEDYVEQRIGIVRQYAYRLIDLAETVTALSPIGDKPAITNEGQARAIKPVLRDHGPKVAAEILTDAAASGKITARSITDAAERRFDTAKPEAISAEEFIERYDADNEPAPDLDDLIPADLRFQRRFSKRLLTTHDLLTDMDYPQYFDEDMADRLASFVDNLTRKHTEFTKSRRTLRVVQGGNP